MKLLGVPHSSFYYKSHREIHRVASDEQAKDEIMNIYENMPFYGVPRLTVELKRRGYKVNHKRVRRLQKLLGLQTVYPRPHFNTSEPHPEHEKFPYLLRELTLERPNQVWSTDITYTAVAGHRAFVIGIVDWFSRKVMAYNVVNTMDAFHCVDTLRMAVERFGKPEIFNSDQGSQFTSNEFIDELKSYGIRISMDGRGRCLDNAKMERFWWALKYEDIKIKEYVSLPQLRFGVQHYVIFYNVQRIHSALQYKTPDEVYFGTCNLRSNGYSNSKVFTPIF
ncbi:MAG: IS3 family transposase [Victivallaceae bacterium]|nr:IS3 family transposase [Victivallaceae bacterium]MDD4431871.1 IS3 family transposase [Bacteroidales bacterium]